MTKSITWTSCNRLACAGQQSPEVVLCLTDAALVNPVPHERSTIDGVLTKVWKDGSACGSGSFRYLISYDENQLADPATALTVDQIDGVFCKSCLTTWVDDEINSHPAGSVCVADSTTIDFSVDEDGCVTGSVQLSDEDPNAIHVEEDGLLVCVHNSGTVDISLDEGGCISAEVSIEGLISTTEGNILVSNGDGLFVPPTGGGDVCVTDSATIDFSIDGGGCVTGSVIISEQANNVLRVDEDGGLVVCISTTSTIDLFIGEGDCIYGEVYISDDAGNGLESRVDGLFVEQIAASDRLVADARVVVLADTSAGSSTLTLNVGASANQRFGIRQGRTDSYLLINGGQDVSTLNGAQLGLFGVDCTAGVGVPPGSGALQSAELAGAEIQIGGYEQVYISTGASFHPKWNFDNVGNFNQDHSSGRDITFYRTGTGVALPSEYGVVATGTVIGDARQLVNVVSTIFTTPAGSGVKLWTPQSQGMLQYVQNLGANALNVYPATGAGQISLGGAGNPYVLPAGKGGIFHYSDVNAWVFIGSV